MTQDIGNFALIKNELLRKVVMYYAVEYRGSIQEAVSISKNTNKPHSVLLDLFHWNSTFVGYRFWKRIYFRLKQDPATELTESELKTLQPIINKINEQCK